MTSLDKAVYQRALTATLLPGGVHWDSAPAAVAAKPEAAYLVLSDGLCGVGEYDTEGTSEETHAKQLSVFGTTREGVKAALAELEGLFVSCDGVDRSLTLDHGQYLDAALGSSTVLLDPDRAEGGAEVWQGAMMIEFQVARSPGEN